MNNVACPLVDLRPTVQEYHFQLGVEDAERDEAPDLRGDGQDERDQVQAQQAEDLGCAGDPPDEAGEEEQEPDAQDAVREDQGSGEESRHGDGGGEDPRHVAQDHASDDENDNGDDREDVSQPADQLVLHTEHVESFEVHFPSYAAALTAGGRRGAMECGPRR